MKKIYSDLKKTSFLLSLLTLSGAQLSAQNPQTFTFTNTGAVQMFTIPSCVSVVTLEVNGAQGGTQTSGGTGGLGAYVKGVMSVTSGQVLALYVGGQNGYNGGGTGGTDGNTSLGGPAGFPSAFGGGASDIRLNGTALANRIIVAGGGGGGGSNGNWPACQPAGPAGNGGNGGLTGAPGTSGSSTACNCGGGGGNGGGGATATLGGAAGTYNNAGCLQTWSIGNPGVLGDGGTGSATYYNGTGGGGGGGGGYYGGGSGASGSDTTPGGGGGGGSSYTDPSLSNTVITSGVQSGDGLIVISYITNGGAITLSTSGTEICSGSNTTLTASGLLSYTWSTGSNSTGIVVSPQSTTTYSVVGTNSLGCNSNAITIISVDSLPSISIVANPASICAGDTTELTASSSMPATYLWDNGATTSTISVNPFSSVVYTVTGTNTITGCVNTQTLSPSVAVTTFVIVGPTAICKGESAVLTASGAASGYLWSNTSTAPSITVNPTNNFSYYVTGSTGNCSTSNSIALTVNALPTITVSLARATICKSEPAVLTASGSSTTYSWSNGASTPSISVVLTSNTTFTVTGTDTNNCSKATTITQVVAACVGIEEFRGDLDNLLSIYPNPSNGDFTIKVETAMNISIVNETGQRIKQVKLTDSNNQLNITNLANGVYFIVVEKDGHTATKKVVVNKQ